MNQNYISSVRLSSPIDDNSYLQQLPVVRQLAQMGELSFAKPVTFLIGENGIASVDYRQTEHYQLTRRFLEHPERMLHYLLDEEGRT